jgi:RNA polymerase sigma-70 factor (ECF subfamily)
MQEAIITMWRKYATFEADTNFTAWAAQIARYMVMNYYRKKKENIARFSQQAYEKIMEISDEMLHKSDDRMRALQGCIAKLKPEDTELLSLRYSKNKSVKQIARDMDRPLGGLYKVMIRIHSTLRNCVNKTLSAWDMPQ